MVMVLVLVFLLIFLLILLFMLLLLLLLLDLLFSCLQARADRRGCEREYSLFRLITFSEFVEEKKQLIICQLGFSPLK